MENNGWSKHEMYVINELKENGRAINVLSDRVARLETSIALLENGVKRRSSWIAAGVGFVASASIQLLMKILS